MTAKISVAEIRTATKAVIAVAMEITMDYITHGSATPESTIYTALGSDMQKYESFARLLEGCGMLRKSHAWYPGESIIAAAKARQAAENAKKN